MLTMDWTMKDQKLMGRLALTLAASAALLAPTQGLTAEDPLVCFRDPGGHELGLGQDVLDRQGRAVGWVSVSQCAGQPRSDLLVRLRRELGGALAVVPQDKVQVREGRAIVSYGPDELRRLAGDLPGSG